MFLISLVFIKVHWMVAIPAAICF